MQFSFDLQIASSGSGSQNMKNQRTVICPGVFFWGRKHQNQRTVVCPSVFFGGERIRIKEPSVEVISETSKNRRFS
jgi:hypothetical protein